MFRCALLASHAGGSKWHRSRGGALTRWLTSKQVDLGAKGVGEEQAEAARPAGEASGGQHHRGDTQLTRRESAPGHTKCPATCTEHCTMRCTLHCMVHCPPLHPPPPHPLVQMGALVRGLKARGRATSAGASCQQATAPAAHKWPGRQVGGQQTGGRSGSCTALAEEHCWRQASNPSLPTPLQHTKQQKQQPHLQQRR